MTTGPRRRPSAQLRLLVALDRSRRTLDTALEQVAQSSTTAQVLTEKLVERDVFAHAILDGVDVGIITTDRHGIVTFVNRSARQLLQMVTTGTGGDVRDLLNLAAPPDELLLGRSPQSLAFGLVTHDGTELDLELTVSRAEGGVHDELGFFFIFRDVREEKARTAERERFERLVAIGTMVAGFAHEVRNPVAALRSLAESLLEETEAADARPPPQVSRMLQVLERIERLVRTSLQFGRPAAPRRASHRPWSIVAGAITELLPRTQEVGGEIRIEAEPDLPDVYVDDTQLVQVLVILINNAIDAVGSARRVLVRVSRGRAAVSDGRLVAEPKKRDSQPPQACDVVRFEVHDDGPGIPAEIVSRVFDPFFTTKPSGTGLGLSIAQQIVSENGGGLEVVSTRGATTFSVAVPLALG